jgi:hypothetical protein
MVWADRAVEVAEEAEGEGAEVAIIDIEEGSGWWRSRRCNDKF